MVEGKNPIVIARIGSDPHKPTVVVYGHYDVQPASPHGWICDPWDSTSVNGYMYGRGVTDDKGPILATIFAIQELMEDDELPVNVVFAYEGEQEQSKNASCGFHEAVTSHMSMCVSALSL
jgi:acetylornithine deacetylase/succinyl-diaminopimelate desuccinylase-like protein